MLSPPTCVGLRYGLSELNLEVFLGSVGSTTSGLTATASRLSVKSVRICLVTPPTRLHHHPTGGWPTLLRHPVAHSNRYGNINPFPISYAFPPRLRGRLTLGRLTLPRKPWAYGEQVSHLFYRYSCQHNHFSAVHHSLRDGFTPQRTLPYRPLARSRSFGAMLSPDTFSARGH